MLDYLRNTVAPRLAARARRARQRGASAVEYGLLVAGIAAVVVVAVTSLGPVVKDAFHTTCTSIVAAENASPAVAADCAE